MSNNAQNGMTKTIGYYNGNRWPIQLVISKLNITLTLEPGKYILDRQQRKINDPYFEVFANNKQLHREIGTKEVPIIAIPEVAGVAAPSAQTNPVRAVTEWTRDSRGLRQPVLSEPAPAALPQAVVASASASVRPMSMEEARRQGLVRKVREVPEDYGVNDTTGLPPSGIPKMRYSIDPGVNKQAPPLPKEMLALPKDDPNNATRMQLVAGLSKSSTTPAPEDASANPFSNTAVVNAPPDSPIVAGTPAAQPVMESEEALPEPSNEPDIEPMLAAPDLEEEKPAAPPAPPVPLRPVTQSNRFVCLACGAPHKWRSQLVKHAKQAHPARLAEIMAHYPESNAS